MRHIFASVGMPAAGRYTSHGFRAGAAQGVMVTGAQCPFLADAGRENSPELLGFSGVLDDLSSDMAKLVFRDYEFGHEEVPHLGIRD